MTSINPINVNTQGIASSQGFGTKPKTEEKEEAKTESNPTPQQSQVAANDVLNYMAQSAVSVTPAAAKTVDPAKYVDGESASRISSFMSQFEDIVAENLSAISQEFPEMTPSSQQALALAQVNAKLEE